MGARKDLTGQIFGRLEVIDFAESKNKRLYWNTICICGKSRVVQGGCLTSGHTKSCGCIRLKHNLTNHKIYRRWVNIKSRCYDKNKNSYKDYGGRGIKVCEEWKNDFMRFYHWVLKNGYAQNLELDRIDNDGNYAPNNCRFVTRRVNSLNGRLLRKSNSSGFRGVYWYKAYSKWKSGITINYKAHEFGYFKSLKDAVEARNKFIVENNLEHEYQIQEFKG